MNSKHRSKVIEIIFLIAFIVVMSFAIINIKDMLTKETLGDSDEAVDLAKTLEEPIVIEEKNTNSGSSGQNGDAIAVKNGAIAVIDIPSVGIRGQVVEGTSDAVLKNYIGKFPGTANPGEEGNFSVAAHNNIYTEIFRNLHKVKVNAKVRVITKQKEYIYLVKSIDKIAPTKTDVINEDKTQKEMTLITCSDMSKTRIVVKANLIEQKDVK